MKAVSILNKNKYLILIFLSLILIFFLTDQLSITNNIADLVAPTVWGALRGLETFTQLLTPSGQGTNVI